MQHEAEMRERKFSKLGRRSRIVIIRQSAGQKKTRIDARGGYIHSQSIVHRHLRTTKVECNRYWCNVTKGIQVGFLVDADTFDHLDQHFNHAVTRTETLVVSEL